MDNSNLERWRQLDATTVLLAVADYAKVDASYTPVKSTQSSRWHVSHGGVDFELILTSEKFWDTRSQVGGGGAVDLVMRLTGQSFKEAVRTLQRLGL